MDYLKHLSKRERVLFIVASSCVVLAIVYRLVVIPVSEKNTHMDEQILEKTAELAMLRAIAARQTPVGEDHVRLKQTFKVPGNDKELLREFQKNLEKYSSDTGVRISKMVPRKVTDEGWAKIYLVDLSIEASTKQIVDFLYRLNNAESVYRTDSFHLYRKGKDAAGNDLGASLTVSMLVATDGPSAPVPADS